MTNTKTRQGSGKVELKDNLIHASMTGFITRAIAEEMMSDTKHYADQLKLKGIPPRLLLDITQTTGQDSGARTAAKDIKNFDLNKIAVFGGRHSVSMVGQYIARAGGMGKYTKFLKTRKQAMQWLNGEDVTPTASSFLPRLIGSAMLFVVVAVLVGWATDNETLKRIAPGLTSMNPTTAVCLGLLSIAIVLQGAQQKVSKRLQTCIIILCGLLAVIGLIVLLRYVFGIEINIDRILFSSKLDSPGYPPSKIAPNAALNIVLLSTVLILSTWRSRASRISAQLLILISLVTLSVSLFGYSFGFDVFYKLGNFVPIALHTAIVLLLLNIAILFGYMDWLFTSKVKRRNRSFILWMLVALLAFSLTGISWRQAVDRVQLDARTNSMQELKDVQANIDNRFNSYINTLDGLRSFFASSDYVNRGDFHDYVTGLNLKERYPGFSAITFVQRVPNSQKQAFINQVRNDKSLPGQTFPNFTIYPNSTSPTYFPLLYLEQGTSTVSSVGYDIGSSDARIGIYTQASKTAQPVASSTVNLNSAALNTDKVRNGFFIAMPIFKGGIPTTEQDRQSQVFGFVNASFEYKYLFSNLLDKEASKGVSVKLYDTQSEEVVYEENANSNVQGSDPLIQRGTVTIGGRNWDLVVTTPNNFGITSGESSLPLTTIVGGGLVSLLLLGLYAALSQSRGRAMKLAEAITVDLRSERNAAVALQQKDDAILSSIGDAVFAINMKSQITLFNPVAEKISGFKSEEALGKPYKQVLNFINEQTGSENDMFITKALSGHISSMKNHTILIRKDGKSVAVADSAAPIRDQNGEIDGVIVVFRDVSKEYELDRAKTEFVSLASHQLRTPLSAINWFGEMLLNGDAGKLGLEQKKYVQEIYDGNQRMIDLVNALLDVSRLDLGKLTNVPEDVDITKLAEMTIGEMAGAIKTGNINFHKTIDRDLPTLKTDPKLLKMVLQNLLSNAVKYTPQHGDVTLAIEHKQRSLLITVSDTGYGIPDSQQSKIFTKLFRADNVQTLDVEGTGLGLYIVREVTTKLGGTVRFVSREGKGTTFYVELPVHTSAVLK